MKALIIAAGRGRRLRPYTKKPKCLIHIFGLSLIERVIISAKEAGIQDFIIVTGYQGESIKRKLGDGSHLGVRIRYAYNSEWKRGNALSVLAAEHLLRDEQKFILLMSDHLFDSKVLVELLRQEVGDGCLLAVDRNLEICDLSEATKVKTTDGKIVSIGKNIPEYDAIDTGIFLCTPTIFDAIEKVVSQKRDALSDAVDLLARRGKASTIDISGFWIDVDTPSDLKLARKIVSQRSVKPTNGVISRYINRRFSTQIFTPLILKVYKEVTPNQASLLSFIVGVISALFFFLLRPVMGGFFVQLASILDGCDGEIARYKNMHSNLGDFIDAVLDRYADSFILLGMFYFSLVTIGNKEVFGIYWTPLLIIGISVLAILGNLMVSYSSAKSIASLNYRYEGRWIATGRGRDLRLFLLFLGGVLSFFHPISVFFALLIIALQTNLIVIWRIILSWKIFRDEE